MTWQNWAHNQTTDAPIITPQTMDDLQNWLAQSNGTLRCVGAGHSFSPLVTETDAILSLESLPHIPMVDHGDGTATLDANTRLHVHSEDLMNAGLAFRNMGDINLQTLAGAAATATHGTGRTLMSLSDEILGGTALRPDGEIITFDQASPDLGGWQSALGVLGILLTLRINVAPRYRLRRQVKVREITESIADMHIGWNDNRHYELFWLPSSSKAIEIRHNITTDPVSKPPVDLDALGLHALRAFRAVGRISLPARRALVALLAGVQSDENYVGESATILASARGQRFKEMEYHVPVDAAQDVVKAVIARYNSHHPHEYYPIEVRQTAQGSGWLSPFHAGPCVSIALHVDARDPHSNLFNDIEPIFRSAGGRPHWGKMHSLAAVDLHDLYPKLNDFNRLRQDNDPSDRFLTTPMKRLLCP